MNSIIKICPIALTISCSGIASAQTWSSLKNPPPVNIAADNPLLLTDGSVLIHDIDSIVWWKLTPDNTGSYIDGTWTQLPSTPGYQPLYYGSQVMPDGRVFMLGGEYNITGGYTNKGELYDPVLNTFTPITAPSPWSNVGDMASVTLPNGTVFMNWPIGNSSTIFNPATNTFSPPSTKGNTNYNNESGLTLLPNGKILTLSCWNTNEAFLFDPKTLLWSAAPNTPYNIVAGAEIGPALVRYDGTVICFGANGSNVTYNPLLNSWAAAPSFPKNADGSQPESDDAPGCILPNGNVLVEAEPGPNGSGSQLFEYNGTTFTPAPSTPNLPNEPAFYGNFLILPTGQALYTDFSSDIEIYTPSGSPLASWAPVIVGSPVAVKEGSSYTVSGYQFNGLTGGSSYGDDEENETNYPLVRITNNATKHVFYCREFSPSTMAIATGSAPVSTNFQVPKSMELGASTIQVVTNGIASNSKPIFVYPPIEASAVSVLQGTQPGRGSLQNVWLKDGLAYSTGSVLSSEGAQAAIEADFVFPTTTIAGLTITSYASAATGVTGFLYAYNYSTKQFVELSDQSLKTTQSLLSATTGASGSQFIGPGGHVRVVVRGVLPPHVSPNAFTLAVDEILCQIR